MQRWQRHKTAHPLGGNLQAHTGADHQEGRHCCATWALPLAGLLFSSLPSSHMPISCNISLQNLRGAHPAKESRRGHLETPSPNNIKEEEGETPRESPAKFCSPFIVTL